MDVLDLDALRPGFTADPYTVLARLRELEPVRQVRLAGLRAWLVTRYDDVRAALRDPRLCSDRRHSAEEARQVPWATTRGTRLSSHMLRTDPPDHSRLRRIVSSEFTPRRVEALRSDIERIADELVAGMAGQADLIRDYASPLPVRVITRLLGVPMSDVPLFLDWMNLIAGFNPGDAARIPEAFGALESYLDGLVLRKVTGDDLLSALIALRGQDMLTADELVATCFLLLIAGFSTTVDLIGNGAYALLTNPDQLAALRNRPELLDSAIEEFLRFHGPLDCPLVRFTSSPVEIGGVAIPANEPVILSLAAADRDPAVFAEPDRLDIARSANAHMAFGLGTHYCLGAPLARLEAQVAFPALMKLDLELLPGAEWRVSQYLRGLKNLPVQVGAPTGR